MSDEYDTDDLAHLPTAGSEEEIRRAKAELWRKIAEQHRAPEPEPEPELDGADEVPVEDPSGWSSADEAGVEELAPTIPEQAPQARKSSSTQDGKALWQEFLREGGGSSEQAEAPLDAPAEPAGELPPAEPKRAQTPRVKLSSAAVETSSGADTGATESPDADEGESPTKDDKAGKSAIAGGGSEAPPEEPADNAALLAHDRKRSWMVAGAFHLLVILVMAIVRVVPMEPKMAEIVAIPAADEMDKPAWKKVTTAMPKSAMLQPSVAPIMASATSNFAMPDVDLTPTANELNVGASFGTFGTGVSKGGFGSVSFLGNQGAGQYVVFVVDVSGSMSAASRVGNSMPISRFELLKRELNKSLAQITGGTKYQILYFSDFAWPHNEVDSNDYTQLSQYAWVVKPSDRDPKIPRFQYITASPVAVRKSREIVSNSNNPGGTNWGSGLLMALNATPRPDVIFFLTDGSGGDAAKWVDVVTKKNGVGKRSVIHTTAMMEPETAEPLAELARRNGGKFTVVMANGAVIKGEDYFSGRR